MAKATELVKLNWRRVTKALDEKNWKQVDLSEALGMDPNFVSHCKNRGTIRIDKVKPISLILGIPEEELLAIMEDEPMMDESNFEKEMRESLKEIKETLNLLMEVVGNVEAEVKNKPKVQNKSPQKQAEELLGKMLTDTGSCKYADFENALKVMGISNTVIKSAVENCQSITKTVGYGNNKCKWITRTRDNGIYRDSDIKVVGE